MEKIVFKINTLAKTGHQVRVRQALVNLSNELVAQVKEKQTLNETDITSLLDKAFKTLMERVGK